MSKSLDKLHDELNELEKLLFPLYSEHVELFESIFNVFTIQNNSEVYRKFYIDDSRYYNLGRYMKIQNNREYFNNNVDKWIDYLTNDRTFAIEESLKLMNVDKENHILEIGSGTGTFYSFLDLNKSENYLGVDISEEMLGELKKKFPKVKTCCIDFEKKINLERKFDIVVLFDSIPHFERLDILFENAMGLLNKGGVFYIIHSKTRNQLKEHHKKINYILNRDAIPNDISLEKECSKLDLKNIVIKDEKFFFFSCQK
ncbi:MAG: class I SAM-dependent methyltransferase [Psychrilyobacter sp.]|uniref:class I SAM-dependent DNA methyltransferase n=1 Tax=Psychrilyobacter sp. TaxID=2586924 RepID=UPI003C778CB9